MRARASAPSFIIEHIEAPPGPLPEQEPFMTLEIVSRNKSFGGWHTQYSHHSRVLACPMRFAIYLPPQAM